MSETTQPTAPPQGTPTTQPKQPGKGCAGCLGIIVLCFIIGFIADIAGCNPTTETQTNKPARDPNLRYVGSRGAVAGYDNHGRTTRLAPGTALRAAGGSYMDPMAGPKKIYVVTEGELRGMQVPLSESDLEPQ